MFKHNKNTIDKNNKLYWQQPKTKKCNTCLNTNTKPKKVFDAYFKKTGMAFLVLVLCVSCFFACKNTDTYLNSYYFKDNKSNSAPEVNNVLTSTDSNTVTDLAKAVMPSVVAIVATQNSGASSIGSGVCVKSGGYILTNSHVVNGAKKIELYFSGSTSAAATAIVLWEDEIMDVAVLKSNIAIPYLQMADNTNSDIGQDVLAIGTPFSLNFNHSVTRGIISALNRTIKFNTGNGSEALMQNLIQHDASINPGNSGGPLIDLNGRVVGINTIKITAGEGMGFAIPISSVESIVENVYKNFNYKTPFLGVFGFDNALNASFSDANKPLSEGLYVDSVSENSPAAVAGIQVGDVILKIDGQDIENATLFRKYLFKNKASDTIVLTVLRDETEFDVSVKLAENKSFTKNIIATIS